MPSASFGQIAPLHRERAASVKDAYAAALGREPSAQELYFWELYPETPPGIVNLQSVFSALLHTLDNSRGEREAAARRVLDAVFAREEDANPRLRAYLEDRAKPPLRRALADLCARRSGGGYRGLVAWLSRPEIRQHFIDHTGMLAFIASAAADR